MSRRQSLGCSVVSLNDPYSVKSLFVFELYFSGGCLSMWTGYIHLTWEVNRISVRGVHEGLQAKARSTSTSVDKIWHLAVKTGGGRVPACWRTSELPGVYWTCWQDSEGNYWRRETIQKTTKERENGRAYCVRGQERGNLVDILNSHRCGCRSCCGIQCRAGLDTAIFSYSL